VKVEKTGNTSLSRDHCQVSRDPPNLAFCPASWTSYSNPQLLPYIVGRHLYGLGMEVFSCVAAVASLGKSCLSTIKSLHNLYEKYQSARRTIAALHVEVAVIGASMQFVNVIFEEHQEIIKLRFTKIPELEHTFAAALAGCNLVLSCLDEDLEKILSRLGPEGSKSRKGKARMLWREDAMKDLLLTLRGQQSAIFSIIQCLHLYELRLS